MFIIESFGLALFRIFLKHTHAIEKHDVTKFFGWRSRIYFSPKSVTNKLGDSAQMINVGMRHKEGLNRRWSVGKWIVVFAFSRLPFLKKSAIYKNFFGS